MGITESTFVVIGTDRDRKTGALKVLLAHNDGTGPLSSKSLKTLTPGFLKAARMIISSICTFGNSI
jgi:hypothetical protein